MRRIIGQGAPGRQVGRTRIENFGRMDGQHGCRLHELGRNSHLSCEIVRKEGGRQHGDLIPLVFDAQGKRHQSGIGGTAGSL
jgi:hypothetical protein